MVQKPGTAGSLLPALSHLVRRGDAFYFRMAVPSQIASRVQTCEVKVSLRTSDPLAAKVRSRLLSDAFDVMFKGLETMPEVTTETIHERIKGHFQGCLNRSLEHSQLLPSDPAVDLEQEV